MIQEASTFNISDGLIVANVGTLMGIMWGIIRLIWWLSKADSRIDDAKSTGIRAHKRIDEHEKDHD